MSSFSLTNAARADLKSIAVYIQKTVWTRYRALLWAALWVLKVRFNVHAFVQNANDGY